MLKANKYKFSEVPQRYWDFAHKYGTIFQSKPYLDCLIASGTKLVVIEIVDGEEVVGGAGVTLRHKILNFALSATTLFGPVVGDVEKLCDVFCCFTGAVKSMCVTFGISVLPEHAETLKTSCDLSNWTQDEYESLRWDISKPLESLWDALPKRKRRYVRSTRRDGIIVEEIETEEQVEQAYKLHSLSMRRGGVSPQPLRYYKNLFCMLRPKGLAAGFLALHPETRQPIAVVILLLGTHGEAVHLVIGYDHEFQNLHGSDLLMWHCVEFLKSKGFVLFDLLGLVKGNSARAKGIRNYKLAWAGDNGRRCPSFVLSRANFGINPRLLQKASGFPKKVVKSVMKLVKG